MRSQDSYAIQVARNLQSLSYWRICPTRAKGHLKCPCNCVKETWSHFKGATTVHFPSFFITSCSGTICDDAQGQFEECRSLKKSPGLSGQRSLGLSGLFQLPLSSGSRQKSRNLRCRPSGQPDGQKGRHGVHGQGPDSPSSSFRHPRGAQQVSARCCPSGSQVHNWPHISVDTQRRDLPSYTHLEQSPSPLLRAFWYLPSSQSPGTQALEQHTGSGRGAETGSHDGVNRRTPGLGVRQSAGEQLAAYQTIFCLKKTGY